MKLQITDGKLYKETLFSTKEISASNVEKIVVENNTINVYLISGKCLSAKGNLSCLFDDAVFFVKNNVTYENDESKEASYTASQIEEMITKTRDKAKELASKIVKEKLGEDYDMDVEIVGEAYYSIMVFRLSENGQVLYDHPFYEEIGELGVKSALVEMDLSYLVSWDAIASEGKYGVTEQMTDDAALEDYIRNVTCEKVIKNEN